MDEKKLNEDKKNELQQDANWANSENKDEEYDGFLLNMLAEIEAELENESKMMTIDKENSIEANTLSKSQRINYHKADGRPVRPKSPKFDKKSGK